MRMTTRRLTSRELDAYEGRWKLILFACAVVLVVDLAYMVGTHPRGLHRTAGFFIIGSCAGGCIIALRRLHKAGLTGTKGSGDIGRDAGDLDISDIIDTVSGDD